ncbi:MAG TPA: hypothetical protein VHE54_06155 [Puia sp.]|nr:hypothetical protein [Puia sp.]
MRLIPCLLVAVQMLPSGKSLCQGVPNMNKWSLGDRVDRQPLRGHPKEVIEYSVVESDSGRPGNWRAFYIRYRFNEDGDMIYRGSYVNDKLVTTDEFQYGIDGLQGKSTDFQGHRTAILRSRPLGNHAYKTVSTDFNGKVTGYISTILQDGRDQTAEKYHDTTMAGKPFYIEHDYFDTGRLSRSVIRSADGRETVFRFFYSRWDQPDSILVSLDTDSSARLVRREIFFNNEHGNPGRRLTIEGEDTTGDNEYKYEYDTRGNWTRRVDINRLYKPPANFIPPLLAMHRKFIY